MKHTFEVWITFDIGHDDPTEWMEDVAAWIREEADASWVHPTDVECADAWETDSSPPGKAQL
jgi:hypothetical protein